MLRNRSSLSAAFAIIAQLVCAAASTAQEAPDEPRPDLPRPNYPVNRFEEDWSFLRDVPPERRNDLWDPIKYVPLDDAGDWWLSVGGHVRGRVEGWSNYRANRGAENDDVFGVGRILLHADVHYRDRARAFVELKAAGATDRSLPGGRRALDTDTFALQQAFVDWRFDLGEATTLTLRPGRQAFIFGSQRLVSVSPWGNTFRRWDGVDAIVETPDWRADVFLTEFAPTKKYEFNEPEGNRFWGVFASSRWQEGPRYDLYYLGVDNPDVTFNGTTGRELRHTVGGRIHGKVERLDYDAEAALQFGQVGDGDVFAWFAAVEGGRQIGTADTPARIHLALDYASGDDGSGGDVGTFNELYPLGHRYLGFIDIVGRQNIVDLHGGASVTLGSSELGVQTHSFWLANANDALYDAGAAIVRPPSGDARYVGTEVDVTLVTQIDRHLSSILGYSHLFAGSYLEQTGDSADIDFVYGQLQYTF